MADSKSSSQRRVGLLFPGRMGTRSLSLPSPSPSCPCWACQRRKRREEEQEKKEQSHDYYSRRRTNRISSLVTVCHCLSHTSSNSSHSHSRRSQARPNRDRGNSSRSRSRRSRSRRIHSRKTARAEETRRIYVDLFNIISTEYHRLNIIAHTITVYYYLLLSNAVYTVYCFAILDILATYLQLLAITYNYCLNTNQRIVIYNII